MDNREKNNTQNIFNVIKETWRANPEDYLKN